jgi:CheY-like chemotaxis protein
LQQIVWNLLANAVKFTQQGGRVNIRLEQVGHYAQIVVNDTGKGIDPDFLPYVFDYFRQENSTTTRKFGGLGLGLAIVRHLVELHGGTVQADSTGVGEGASFTVRLPLMSTQPQILQNDTQSESCLDLNGVTVLLVDDDADTREFVTFLLEEYRASVTAVTQASEVLAALTQSLPDVLLSDIGMPEVDGYTLIRQIRTLPLEQGGQIPAIALTAYAGEMNEEKALSAGFQKHISKPVDPSLLVEAISDLLMKIKPQMGTDAHR